MKIDFVSDVSCPWCAIGLRSLETAIERLEPELRPTLRFQPFELNPQMGADGQDIAEHLTEKYGLGPEQLAQNSEAIRARGAALGFTFTMGARRRIYNTFDAHRLLHWAELEGRQLPLKHALFKAYFTDGQDPSDHDTFVHVAESVGLDGQRAREVLDSDAYTEDVRREERHWQQLGIHAVPAVIIDDQHLIQGGQPPEIFEQALRQIAASGGAQ